LRKEGSGLDLPIALGILAATGQCTFTSLAQYVFSGELSLEGTLRPVPGVLSMAITLDKQNSKAEIDGGPFSEVFSLIVPPDNLTEARLVTGLETHSSSTLAQIVKAVETKNVFNDEVSLRNPQAGSVWTGQISMGNCMLKGLWR